MKILYISSVPSKEQFEYMKANLKEKVNPTKYGMQESGFKFHTLIQQGILSDTNNEIYSIVGRSTSIKMHKNLIWRKKIEKKERITYYHIGYLNIPVLKNIIVSFSFFFKALEWLIKNSKEEKIIILDAAYITVLPFINLATMIKKCKKIAIVCDIYEYMADVKDASEKKLKTHMLIRKFMKNVYKAMDAFVFLTKEMNPVLNPLNKPYIIMEGLVNIDMQVSENDIKNKAKKDVILYAGAIRVQYGLKNLVEGFHEYKNKNAELWIYGTGDYVEELKKWESKDSRIKYGGFVSLDVIEKMETSATLLVNPRSTNQEFTKYSFPSKNMEYMVSGTPILTTRLSGMPKEYYKYIYTIDGNTKKDITAALEKALSFSKEELHQKGMQARKFVLKNKNNIFQANRIINIFKENENEKENN